MLRCLGVLEIFLSTFVENVNKIGDFAVRVVSRILVELCEMGGAHAMLFFNFWVLQDYRGPKNIKMLWVSFYL